MKRGAVIDGLVAATHMRMQRSWVAWRMRITSNTRDLGARFDGAVMKGNLRIDGRGVTYPVEFVRN